MKIRLKGQYASARAAEESPASSTQQNGRRSQKQAEADVEEQQPDGEEDNVDEEGQQEGGSTSVSSEADEDYLNAPLNDLPESSGDEYYAPPSASTRPRGRPLGSKNRRRSTRESESPDVGRPVRSKRTSISSVPAERPSVSHPRRSAAAASPAIAHTSTAKRGRGRPPGSLNKKGKKGKARSESVNDDEEDEDSAADIDDPDDSAMLDEDEEASTSIVQSGQSTPSGRVVYGADGRRRGGAVGTSRMKAVKGQKYELANDELALPVDPKGEEKVDAMGRLQGGELASRPLHLPAFRSDTPSVCLQAANIKASPSLHHRGPSQSVYTCSLSMQPDVQGSETLCIFSVEIHGYTRSTVVKKRRSF